jgi:DNA-directed RNA polymerase specialized sigma54-like protein
MKKITITIKTENAAFQDGNLSHELARILQKIVSDLENNGFFQQSYNDINGNKVCEVKAK